MKTQNNNPRRNAILISFAIFGIVIAGKNILHAQSFIPDELFGKNSTTVVDIRNSPNISIGAIVTSGGKYLMAGNTNTSGTSQTSIGLTQVDICGKLDPGFGRNGIATFRIGYSNYISDIKINLEGNIAACGYEMSRNSNLRKNPCIYVLGPNGRANLQFNGNGQKVIYIPGSYGEFESIHTLPGNKYLAIGKYYPMNGAGTTQVFAAQVLQDGTFDPQFGVNGIAYFTMGPVSKISSVIIPDGSIIIIAAGTTVSPTGALPNLVFARSDSRGNIDGAFGVNGYIYSSIPVHANYPKISSLIPDGENYFILAIQDALTVLSRVRVMRLNFNGVPDPLYGNNGVYLAGNPDSEHILGGITYYDTFCYVYGNTTKNGGSGFVTRIDSKGIPDNFFGPSGYYYPLLNSNGKHTLDGVLFHDSQDPIFVGSDQDHIYKKYTKWSKIPVISEQNGILVSTGSGVFQWLYNGKDIIGATTPFYTPNLQGEYQVQFTSDDGCVFITKPYFWQPMVMFTKNEKITLYPNPATDVIRIKIPDQFQEEMNEIRIMDISGRLVMQEKSADLNSKGIDIKALAPGMYIVQLNNNRSIEQTILYKNYKQ